MQAVFLRKFLRPLRELKDENEWTLEEIAKRAGFGASTIGNFLKGKTQASPELLKVLSDVFKVAEGDIENPQPREGGVLREEGPEYGRGTASAGGEAMGWSDKDRHAFNYLVKKMRDEELIEEVASVLGNKGMTVEARFATVHRLLDELEERARRGDRLDLG